MTVDSSGPLPLRGPLPLAGGGKMPLPSISHTNYNLKDFFSLLI